MRKGYEARFELLLQRVGARRVEQGKTWLVQHALSLAGKSSLSQTAAFTRVHDRLLHHRRFRHPIRSARLLFFCDAGLGGLARWLRAAGYEALWKPGGDDGEMVRHVQDLAAILLTTDSLLMDRKVLRDHHVTSLWLPPNLPLRDQLTAVLREFDLPAEQPRCMDCGGELIPGDKEALKTRIPPRTYRWLNQYFTCGRCGKLFWHGTHWERIRTELAKAAQAAASSRPAFEGPK